MRLSFCSFSSGSSGNCYLVKTEKTAILIDAGISASRILKELERTDTPRENVKALFLTHEHHDHVTGVRVLLKKLSEAVVYASPGTFAGMNKRDTYRRSSNYEVSESRRITIAPDEAVETGDIRIRAFRTLHDAEEPYGYYISSDETHIALLTDTGLVTEEMLEYVADAETLVLEANHDTDLLRRGRYPYWLKQRILSDHGHLSNNQAADVLIRLFSYHDKKRFILLAHLSHENNSPEKAEQTVLTTLARNDYYTGRDLYLGILIRDEASPIYLL